VLLQGAMRSSGKAGIAKMVLHSKEHVVAMRGVGRGIVLSTLYFKDEVIPVKDLDLPAASEKPQKKELSVALQLVNAISGKFEPEKYHDEYRSRVMELIERKAQGKEVIAQKAPAAPPRNVVSLMNALKASLSESARKRKQPGSAPKRLPKHRARKSA
jgi:DNA end-binding protein Ku